MPALVSSPSWSPHPVVGGDDESGSRRQGTACAAWYKGSYSAPLVPRPSGTFSSADAGIVGAEIRTRLRTCRLYRPLPRCRDLSLRPAVGQKRPAPAWPAPEQLPPGPPAGPRPAVRSRISPSPQITGVKFCGSQCVQQLFARVLRVPPSTHVVQSAHPKFFVQTGRLTIEPAVPRAAHPSQVPFSARRLTVTVWAVPNEGTTTTPVHRHRGS